MFEKLISWLGRLESSTNEDKLASLSVEEKEFNYKKGKIISEILVILNEMPDIPSVYEIPIVYSLSLFYERSMFFADVKYITLRKMLIIKEEKGDFIDLTEEELYKHSLKFLLAVRFGLLDVKELIEKNIEEFKKLLAKI